MRFEISVFRFDSKFDYNEHYERVKIDIDKSLSLKDLMKEIEKTLENFAYDKGIFWLSHKWQSDF